MIRRKVLACITRVNGTQREVLVFERSNRPGALPELPGGNVGPNERPEEALYRQIEEETGLIHLNFVGELTNDRFFHPLKNQRQERTFFHVESLERPPKSWLHEVSSFGKDDGEQLRLYWMPIQEAQSQLAFQQGKALRHISYQIFSETG